MQTFERTRQISYVNWIVAKSIEPKNENKELVIRNVHGHNWYNCRNFFGIFKMFPCIQYAPWNSVIDTDDFYKHARIYAFPTIRLLPDFRSQMLSPLLEQKKIMVASLE